MNKYLGIATFVLVAQAALFYSASNGENTPLPAALKEFPKTLGAFTMAQELTIDAETLAVLKADDTMTRWYTSPAGGANLYVAYFKTQRQGQSPHSPKNCLPGAGWQPVADESGTADLAVPGGPIRVNRYVVSKGEEEDLVLYWYQSQGRVIADEFAAKLYLISDSIRKHRSDTALVRIVVPVQNQDRARADKTALAFAQATYPTLVGWLPK